MPEKVSGNNQHKFEILRVKIQERFIGRGSGIQSLTYLIFRVNIAGFIPLEALIFSLQIGTNHDLSSH
jgi:hypothetical protein